MEFNLTLLLCLFVTGTRHRGSIFHFKRWIFLTSARRVPSRKIRVFSVSFDYFLGEFKNVAGTVAKLLKEQPVIVAHTENTFDGSGIRRLLSNKFELDTALDTSLQTIPSMRSQWKIVKTNLRVALDVLVPSSGLGPLGAVDQIDKIINEAFKKLDADDRKLVKEDEFKKLLTEILGSTMLQLEGNPISVSTKGPQTLPCMCRLRPPPRFWKLLLHNAVDKYDLLNYEESRNNSPCNF
ncbi:unnamed protein product [Coffea canephora]|uniref:EF-hand domain-containing protein n=1 Tax=Coffea canephora TaxID=49390 RepID=A0A068TL55_COFCA|nr:unnamed protein product [Coffea canephora]